LGEGYALPLVGLFEPLYKLMADKKLTVWVKVIPSSVKAL